MLPAASCLKSILLHLSFVPLVCWIFCDQSLYEFSDSIPFGIPSSCSWDIEFVEHVHISDMPSLVLRPLFKYYVLLIFLTLVLDSTTSIQRFEIVIIWLVLDKIPWLSTVNEQRQAFCGAIASYVEPKKTVNGAQFNQRLSFDFSDPSDRFHQAILRHVINVCVSWMFLCFSMDLQTG